jgi:hypothetical protein
MLCLLRVLKLQKVVDCLCSDRDLGLRGFMFMQVKWDILDQLEDILEVSKHCYVHCDFRLLT